MNLRTPGPTPIPPEVAQAGAAAMIDHRGPEFAAIMDRVTKGAKQIFQTQNDVMVLTTSGTGAMEAAVVNFVSPGEKVLVVIIGEFGKRMLELVEIYGGHPTELAFEFGKHAEPDVLDAALKANPDVTAVLMTHNETSTGVTNPLQQLAEVVKKHDKLIIVDAISSLSSIPVKTDAWNLDVVLSGSQKGWMVAPGLAFASVSPRPWEVQAACTTPRFYLDLKRAADSAKRGQTPWTPAVSLFFQLDKAVELLLAEGMENVYTRQHVQAERVRQGAQALGLELFAEEGYRSDTVTAIKAPEGYDPTTIRKTARENYGMVLAGGQGPLAGSVFRFGHLGYCTDEDIEEGLGFLKQTMDTLGFARK